MQRIHKEVEGGLSENRFYLLWDCPKPSASKFNKAAVTGAEWFMGLVSCSVGGMKEGQSQTLEQMKNGVGAQSDTLPWFDLTSDSSPAGITAGKKDISTLQSVWFCSAGACSDADRRPVCILGSAGETQGEKLYDPQVCASVKWCRGRKQRADSCSWCCLSPNVDHVESEFLHVGVNGPGYNETV